MSDIKTKEAGWKHRMPELKGNFHDVIKANVIRSRVYLGNCMSNNPVQATHDQELEKRLVVNSAKWWIRNGPRYWRLDGRITEPKPSELVASARHAKIKQMADAEREAITNANKPSLLGSTLNCKVCRKLFKEWYAEHGPALIAEPDKLSIQNLLEYAWYHAYYESAASMKTRAIALIDKVIYLNVA